ncbi:EB domain-containing protein [Caenorhabditis elegans]|uniref:EB domain-containing protein n=1 Tax=Caenorhabditis elegans TaxID=6239 RepID=Q9U211_CAEEL|nr:EB domain-containing protein [Caenorhabditis elegans]CAB60767.2 EB domain-containing protein [Caenorhabditis elegans]
MNSQFEFRNLVLNSQFLWIFLINLITSANSEALASPYQYLKDLCPVGQLPLTDTEHVKTCASLCPLGAFCHRGICCVPPPQCRHPAYRMSTGFPCLPKRKNNCPDGSFCVSSSQDGMSICCSNRSIEKSFPITSQLKLSKSAPFPKEKPMQKSTSSLMTSLDSSQICPKSHPIIAHDGKSLVLCKDCVQGVCAKFRTSNVEVCCQSSDDICGVGSQILMNGLVPRDCNKKPCGMGYECSLTPTGLRVCCSLAQCPSGVFARSVCAAGCLRNEKCMEIQNEMWCCPSEESFGSRIEMVCRNGENGTGEKCDPAFPACSQGAFCELNKEKTAHICCKRYKNRLGNSRKTLLPPPFYYTTTTMKAPITIATTTAEPYPFESVPNCQDPEARPLMENGFPYICDHIGDPCILRSGYSCQESDIDDVYVCCTIQMNRILPPQIPMIGPFTFMTSSTTTTTEKPIEEEEVIAQPTCPFSYMPSKNVNQDVQRCLSLFTLDCPLGYTCLPSSTTDSYLCCIRKPVVY